ncbi:MAG: sugar ABC transporter substrate-binding protein [Eubacteriales bacterium]|nr:sugar ABC transporter substrate-binding protein [Eubacteriales bacterium]
MKKSMKRLTALGMAAAMALSMTGCGGKTEDTATAGSTDTTAAGNGGTAESAGEPVTLKITWWGGQSRHDYTQKLLDVYTESHPNVTFEAIPSGWDGYFEKLATQAASGSMPDIVQMDYLYISTYAKNDSLADLQPYIDDGTIDVSGIDENLLNSGKIDGKMNGLVLTSSYAAMGYNPDVLTEAGVEMPDSSWTWDDFSDICKTVKDKTGKYGSLAYGVVDDTNLFKYWVRQYGTELFAEDNKSLGYEDDQVYVDYLNMWNGLIEAGAVPNPDEHAQIQALGQEAGPVVTGDGAFIFEWNNYASKMSGVNAGLKEVTPPQKADSDSKGLWMKPGMFFSVAETSTVKKEAAEFIDWFINSEEVNDIIMAERGTPVSADIRDYMVNSGKLTDQQKAMFEAVNADQALCGTTPAPDPAGISEVNEAFKNTAYEVFYGQTTPEEAAARFRTQADEILARNNE